MSCALVSPATGAPLVGADDLAVEDGISNAQTLRQRPRERVQVPETIAVARDEASARTIDFEERAEAIVFQLEEPIGVVERGGAALQDERRDLGQGAQATGARIAWRLR